MASWKELLALKYSFSLYRNISSSGSISEKYTTRIRFILSDLCWTLFARVIHQMVTYENKVHDRRWVWHPTKEIGAAQQAGVRTTTGFREADRDIRPAGGEIATFFHPKRGELEVDSRNARQSRIRKSSPPGGQVGSGATTSYRSVKSLAVNADRHFWVGAIAFTVALPQTTYIQKNT